MPIIRHRFRIVKPLLLWAWMPFLLTACGGGGGGGGTPAHPPVPAPIFVPRSAPTASILNALDNTSYVTRKNDFEASAEYHPRYAVSGSTDSHLRRINAAAAYARGATGAGETIAIIDTGIRDSHREFLDNGFSGTDKVTKVTPSGYFPDNDDKLHGTFVAALAVGNRDGGNGLNMHGVAFDARVHFTEISLGTSDGTSRPIELESRPSSADRMRADFFGDIIGNAKVANAAIVNLSFGVNGVISSYTRQAIRSSLARTADALAQAGTPDIDKIILVWAAGNAGSLRLMNGAPAPFDSPEIWAGLGAYFPELQSHVLAVVALDQDGHIASYSNRCGIAKDFCLAAPGSNVLSAYSIGDNAYSVGSGTSYAAPIVSGSLALLRQYFRGQLGNTDLVARLLATANRKGIYTDSDTYGHGLVDLDAATAPVGAVVTGLPGDAGNRPFAGSRIALSSGAFGVALPSALADVEVAGFDALGAPFFQSAASWVTRPAQEQRGSHKTRKVSLLTSPDNNNRQHNDIGLSLTMKNDGTITDARLSFTDGWWVSYGQHGGQALGLYEQSFGDSANRRDIDGILDSFDNPLAFAAPYLALVGDGAGIGWSRSSRDGGDSSRRFGFALMHGGSQFERQHDSGGSGVGILLNMTLNRDHPSGAGLALQVGAVRETDGFLGARTQGAFGQVHAATSFVGINGAWALGNDNWQVLASAYLGRTRPQIDNAGLLHATSPIVSSAFSIGTARASIWRPDDWLGLRLSQPLRAERGNVKLRFPVGRTKYGKVVHQNYDVSLVPAGRTIHATAIYRFPLVGGALTTSMGMERHPQHHSAHAIRPFLRLAFERRF